MTLLSAHTKNIPGPRTLIYTPFNAAPSSTNVRYQIGDNYLQFYFRFIHPRLKEIGLGAFKADPYRGLNLTVFEQWLGVAFERLCRHEAHLIAKILQFAGVVYKCGAFFKRGSSSDLKINLGFQIDLVFERADRIYSLCEIKHTTAPIDAAQSREIVAKFESANLPKKYARQRVLISTAGVTKEVELGGYFDRIINLSELMAG